MSQYRVTLAEINGGDGRYSYGPYHPTKEIEADTYKTDAKDNSLIFQTEDKTVAIFAAGSWQSIELIPEPKPSPVLTEEVFLKHMENRNASANVGMTPSISVEDRVKALVKPRALR